MPKHEEKESIPKPGEPSPDEHPDTHFNREDERWSRAAQVRDWIILGAMMSIYLLWTGIIYFLEPGIR
jgi:hypothetical protein